MTTSGCSSLTGSHALRTPSRAETAALGDALRALVVEVGDDVNPHDSMVSKGPLSDETERLHRDATASNPTIKPVERLSSTRGEIELDTDLTSALVRRRHCHREASQTAGPPLEAALDPLPGLILGHRLRHHREPGYVGIPAGLCNRGCIADPERTQSDVSSGEGRIGRHEITHRGAVSRAREASARDLEDHQQHRQAVRDALGSEAKRGADCAGLRSSTGRHLDRWRVLRCDR